MTRWCGARSRLFASAPLHLPRWIELRMIRDNTSELEPDRLEWFQSREDPNVYFGTRADDRLVVVCIPSRLFKVRWIVFDAGNGWSWRRIATARAFHAAVGAAEHYWIQKRSGPSSFVPKLNAQSLKWLPQRVVWAISKRLHNRWFARGLSFVSEGETILFRNTMARFENCLSIGASPDTASPRKNRCAVFGYDEVWSARACARVSEQRTRGERQKALSRPRLLQPASPHVDRRSPFSLVGRGYPALGGCHARSAV